MGKAEDYRTKRGIERYESAGKKRSRAIERESRSGAIVRKSRPGKPVHGFIVAEAAGDHDRVVECMCWVRAGIEIS
jgi:hypothetical protein